MPRRTGRTHGAHLLASLALLWTTAAGAAQAGEILWQYDTGG